jgi:class 3 adenylate cyclase
MAKLDGSARANLPDRAFAYVDAAGRRRLPIHDAAHVRNALARFSQVHFEDDRARDRARTRLLNAAKRFGIVPVGFIAGQLESERGRRGGPAPTPLPSGFVTMLFTDIEGSTELVHRLDDRYGDVLEEVRAILHETAHRMAGSIVETRADELFVVYESPGAALATALAAQRQFGDRQWPDDVDVRVRIGIHSGYPKRTESNYIGMPVHVAARVCSAAHGGQILVTGDVREAAQGQTPEGARYRRLGDYRLRGLPAPVSLYQVMATGLATRFPPPRSAVPAQVQ